jgi:DNA-binding beta-propeller fold protein YncE
VCNGNRSLAEIQLTAFQPPPLPNFPSPGELRTFSVVLQTDPTVPGDNPIGLSPTDIALNDNINSCFYLTASNTKAWHRFPPTIPPLLNNCNKVLVANTASGTVSVINRRNGLLIKTIPVPGVNLLEGFFD